jgi:predicted transcriptional regulator
MVSTKEDALRLIERLPDDVSIEDIIYELYFRQRVDRGLRELDAGDTIPHEQIERSVTEWLQSIGR